MNSPADWRRAAARWLLAVAVFAALNAVGCLMAMGLRALGIDPLR